MDRGQTETVGIVLLLGMTIVGAGAVVAFGATALEDTQDAARIQSAEHSMTQFDSRAAIVALGDSGVQKVPLSGGDGRYTVNDSAGRVVIKHTDPPGGTGPETIYEGTMGAVVYRNGDTVVAYQGGGVWRGTGGEGTMISPPEFHYRAATLTFPVINVTGTGSASGQVTGVVRYEDGPIRIYPNAGKTYEGSSTKYRNPIREGNVTVKVTSDYYGAWAEYFRSRTEGEVTVYDSNDTVAVKLISIGAFRGFRMPSEGNSIEIQGLGSGHPIREFKITLYDDNEDNANFDNLKWSLYAEKGSQQLEIHLRDNSNGACDGNVRATIYYSDNNGAAYQSWTEESAFQYDCESGGEDFNNDGDFDDKRLIANFTSSTPVMYERVSGGKGKIMVYSTGGDTFVTPTTFDEHASSVTWESKTFAEGDELSINDTINHYFELMGPSFDLVVQDKNGNTVNEEASTGYFYPKGGRSKFITFLYITENRIEVTFE